MERKGKKRKKSIFRLRNLFLLIILLLLLLFLDGPFGLGTGLLPLSYDNVVTEPVGPTTEAPITTEGQVAVAKVLIRINDRTIYVDDVLMSLDEVEALIGDAEPDTIFTLKDDQANNTVFEAVEKLLVEYERVYGVE